MSAYKIRRRLQVCAANRLAHRPALLQRLRDEGNVVELVECLDQCTHCDAASFALVSGVFEYASSPEELVERLLRHAGNGAEE